LVVEEDDGKSPPTGEILAAQTISVTVPTSQIRPGDSVLVLPGETIPVDVSFNTVS
jgi:Cu2+-exporting ATPase